MLFKNVKRATKNISQNFKMYLQKLKKQQQISNKT